MLRVKADWLRWWLMPFLLVALFVFTGYRGIDFGYHWDERDSVLLQTRAMVAKGVFLPPEYNYPGVAKLLVAVPALDDGLGALARGADLRQIFGAMLLAIDAADYLLQARLVFLIVSALAIIWVYLAVWVLTRRWWEATLAAAILGLSWEFAYHARWAVCDCILAQFAALCLLLLALYHRDGRARWLWAAAIAAGLAAGTKYQGVLLLAPIALSAVVQTPATIRKRAVRVVAVGVICVGSYLFTTPGTVLDPISFATSFHAISAQYTTGHMGYSVAPGFPHLGLLLRYLAIDLFSPYAPIAVVLFAAASVGAAIYCGQDRKFAAVLVGFPVLYAAYFCSKYSVFIVRNYLLLAPFLAVLSAFGLSEALRRLRWPAARLALPVAAGCALVANAVWLISAGESIRRRDDGTAASEAVAYVRDHPRARFRVSARVTALARQRGLAVPANATQADGDEVVFFAKSEGGPPTGWTANDPWLTRAVFGPREINFNYYSNWGGSDRVVVMTREKARASGIPLAQ